MRVLLAAGAAAAVMIAMWGRQDRCPGPPPVKPTAPAGEAGLPPAGLPGKTGNTSRVSGLLRLQEQANAHVSVKRGSVHPRAPEGALPLDPFQRCAVRALRGDFGPLPEWKRAAYERGLRLGLTTCWRLVLTQYNAHEGHDGRVDRYGRPCGLHTAASNLLPQGYIIWTPRTGLRRVCDCGARSNDVVAARRRGIWVDVWFPSAQAARRAGIDGWVATGAVVIPPG